VGRGSEHGISARNSLRVSCDLIGVGRRGIITGQQPMQPGKTLKELRTRLGITVREVEEQSQKIAEAQRNPEFFVSNNWLTRLENTDSVPSIHKLFSLSAVYRVRVSDLLPMFGIDVELLEKYQIATAPPHTHLVNLEQVDPAKTVTFPVRFDPGFRVEETNLLSRMVQVWGEVPVSLIRQLDIRRGRYGYIGLQDFTMYPLLRPGSFVLIDENLRDVHASQWRTEYDRPIYFVELRAGYACCWCEMKGDELLLIPHPLSSQPHRRFPVSEAEIIGQVAAVAMRIVDPDSAGPSPKTTPQLPKRF
jgi:transcriptional regulator with XRE-family HTH domain